MSSWSRRKRRVQVSAYLDVEQADRLRDLSERTGVPQAVYLREAVDVVLEKHNEEVKS